MAKVVIGTDAQAVVLLRKLLESPRSTIPDVEFDNWPRFEMHVKGARYHSTITPELMESFLDLQKTINQSFALVHYSASSRKLKDSDREDLKILIKVGEGSSGFSAVLEDQVKTIASGIAEGFKNMESKHKLIAILAIGALAVGGYSFNSFMESQKELRLAELKNIDNDGERAERMKALETYKEMSLQQVEKLDMAYGKVLTVMPQIQAISEQMAGTYSKMLASTVDADHVTVQGRKVPGQLVREISNAPRNASTSDRVSSIFRIRGVDHTSKNEYKFKLYDVLKGVEIQAVLPKDGSLVTDQLLDIIQAAEWGGKVVELQLLTRSRSGKLVRAEIEKVTEIINQRNYLK
jgi:hypothetical protein